MALTINNEPTDETSYVLTTKEGQKYNIKNSALGAKNLKIVAPDGTVVDNPSPELLQQIQEYIQQINYNKPYIDAQGETNYPDANQGEVKPAEEVSAPVDAANQYFRELNYRLSHNEVLPGKYTVPGIIIGGLGGAAFSAPITAAAAMAGGWAGSKAVDFGMNLATGKSWAENMHDWTGLDKEPAEWTNPGMWVGGYWVPKYGTNVSRRGIETFMRTSPMQDGLKSNLNNIKDIIASKDYQRMRAIGKYILTGTPTGNKGYYNSFRFASPEEYYYGGFDWIPENLRGKDDVIDAFLYGKEIDSGFGLYKKAQGKDFGTHTDYVADNYSGKAKNIQVYGTSKTEPMSGKVRTTGSQGVTSMIDTDVNVGYDAAGHRLFEGVDAAGTRYTMEQDIWKFKPKEYMKKWLNSDDDHYTPLWQKALMRVGLEATDRAGTPVIVRTPWEAATSNTPKKIPLTGDLASPPPEIYIDLSNLTP